MGIVSTRTVPMWKVTRRDDGSHLAECERCQWKRTYRTMGWGKRAAAKHYAYHGDTPDREEI